MFKRITLIFVLGLTAISAKAQFTIAEDTLYAYGFAGTSASSFVDIEAETRIHSQGLGAEVIKWVRLTNDMPSSEWTSAVCDIISCRSAEVDTGSFVFNGGDSGTLFFHFYIKNVNAKGKMVVRFSRASNPLEYVDVVTFGTGWKQVGINQVLTSTTTSAPNPANNTVTLSNNMIDEGQVEFYNALGQVVFSTPFTNNMNIGLGGLATGIYTVKVSNASYSSFSKLVRE